MFRKRFQIILTLLLWKLSSTSENACYHHYHSARHSEWHCDNLQLRNIPLEIQDQPANVLNFAYNDLKLSSRDMNNFMTLYYRNEVLKLVLDNNSIEELPENLVQVFPNLEKVYLRNNKITKEQNLFNQLGKRIKLYLDNNPITATNNSSTSVCVHNTILDDSSWYCDNEQLSGIPLEIKDKPAKVLNFANNNIKLSSSDMNVLMAFPYRNDVVKLIFDNNSIEVLPENLGQVFPNLEEVDLRNNKITKVKNQFNQLNKLKKLYLDNNPIKKISRGSFKKLKHLEILSLSDTKFTNTKDLLVGNSNLRILVSDTAATTTSPPADATSTEKILDESSLKVSTEDSNMSNLSSYSSPKFFMIFIISFLLFL